MSGDGARQSEEEANVSSQVNVAHVLDMVKSIRRGLATEILGNKQSDMRAVAVLLLCEALHRPKSARLSGFGRGSKLLGIPTANMDMKEIGKAVRDTRTGIYFGYTMLKGTVYRAVVSVGWNPYFDNDEKTVEPHLLHTFEEDFYGEKLHLLLCGFIRNELNFKSLDSLIMAIKGDIEYAKARFLDQEIASLATQHPFWTELAGTKWTIAAADSGSGSGSGLGLSSSATSPLNGDTSKPCDPKYDGHEAYDQGVGISKANESESYKAALSKQETDQSEVTGSGIAEVEASEPETVKLEREKPDHNAQGNG